MFGNAAMHVREMNANSWSPEYPTLHAVIILSTRWIHTWPIWQLTRPGSECNNPYPAAVLEQEMLKELKYLDYELIDDANRRAAELKYGEQNNEAEAAAEKDEEEEKEVDQELVEARIDCTENMLEKILSAFEDNAKLKVLPGFENEWQKYDEQVND